MTARIKISQAGLPAGTAGRARTDGLATGALVTLEDVSGTGSSTFHLLWGPPEDTTAEASLAVTGDPDIWTFSPTAAVYGSYEIELRDDGIPIERRIFGIRTPANHLLIPALNERASRHAGWHNDGADQIDLCEQNANDFPLAILNSYRYAGWWRSLYELYRVVEFGLGSIADHAVGYVKLPLAAAAPSVIGASVNGNWGEMTQATLAASLRGLGMTVEQTNKLRQRNRPRRVQMVDYFQSGSLTTGNIGALGWNLLGVGTPAYTRQDTSFVSSQKNSLTTSAASNDRSILALGETESRDVITAATLMLAQAVVRLPALTSVRFAFGLLSSMGNEPSGSADALCMYYDSAVSPNWQLISRSGSSGSPVNTGVAVLNDSGELISIHQSSPGTFRFYTGNTLLGTISSGISTAGQNIGYRIETLTTVAKTVRMNYFNLEVDTDTGAYATDTFLEV